ncbi:MAG: lipid A export permease/ATP-binding protein MsbA [Pseudomonadota bacterium]|jgi:subfamily B ATP-binding cassette protein MsbA
MTAAPSPSSKELYFRLLGYVRPYWRYLAFAVLAMAGTAATEPLFPALMKPLLDTGFSSGGGDHLILIPLAIVGIFVARGILGYLASYGMSWVANRVITDLRAQMYQRLIRLPASYFQRHPSSVPMTRISYDVTGVASAATSVITVLIRDSLTVIGLLGWLLYLNWKLTLVSIVLVPIIGVVIRSFSSRLRAMSRATQKGTAAMTQVLQEGIACNRVIKVFGGEQQEVQRFHKANNDLRGYGMRQAIAAAATVPIVQFFASIAVAVVVYAALLQSANNETTVGSFVSFITAMLMLLAPMKHLADVNAPLQRGLAAAESVFALLDEQPEKDEGRVVLARAEGRIRFDNVSFRYPGAERDALSRITLAIEPGETVALVGPSGGGKTTLVSLLPRFYTPTSGRILLDGHDLCELTLDSLRAQLALVGQEVLLFNDTVAANIAYGAMRNASPAQVEAAARAAHALDFIRALPQGFDTLIGENGARLSGGQRQRIAIARAILKNAPVLILDEATSALDNESERQVQAALEELMHGRTTIVIAHRLSTVEQADRIVVLQQGSIAEIGSHRELLARDGVYAQLYRLQFAEERNGVAAAG